MKKKSMIFLSILSILLLSGCEDKVKDTKHMIKEEPADQTVFSIENQTEKKFIDKNSVKNDKNSTALSMPPELLNSDRKRVVPKTIPSMPPELEGMERKLEQNKTTIPLAPDGIDLSKIKEPEPLSLPPEFIEKK
jgi:hypothetical protein